MADKSQIEWTEATWNPIAGCSVVSPGCTNCYAMRRVAPRLSANPATPHYAGTVQNSKAAVGGTPEQKKKSLPVWTGKIGIARDAVLLKPLNWRRPRMIFVNSTSDLFHEDVPDAVIDRIFAVMALCPQHTFQVLTKRADRMRQYVTRLYKGQRFMMDGASEMFGRVVTDELIAALDAAPFPNVWLGVSVENQHWTEVRIPQLLETPAAVRFISAEPLLGPLDLEPFVKPVREWSNGWLNNYPLRFPTHCLDWVIAGGESGNGARPMHPDWARGLRDQCAAAGVPFFFKQWGEWEVAVDRERDDPDWRFDYSDHYADRGRFRWLNAAGGHGFHGERFHVMRNAGKHAAGRLLDGVTHDALPGART